MQTTSKFVTFAMTVVQTQNALNIFQEVYLINPKTFFNFILTNIHEINTFKCIDRYCRL